jgi:hypothetical protein
MDYLARVSLPGYDSLTDTNPDHYALYTDGTLDHILIKEKVRGSRSISAFSSIIIPHKLNYVPFVLCFYESAQGVFRKIHGATSPSSSNPYFKVDSINLTLRNSTATVIVMKYYIFYDLVA